MAKIYIANTPLILQDEAGKDFRVETGEAVELTDAQYEAVAVHVSPTLSTGEELDAQQAEISDGLPSETDAERPSENAEAAPADTGKPKRGGRRAKAEAE
ncbi:hypothetical protein [Bergeriella denitrificans]|uniref:Phage protein n=1 Tax=Bergeriella denitrificans TaxID=494 RepID=A0A378URG7_BERDE|nr:hypothetical protein [Bergeriella denitrificans]STZ75302.1 phage protein [Bergeriella denitrificans]STZ76102.1 phage protein [Bergeriella denitrificans]STZ83034.1 phage protein [Bergeriella denitrificans]STZ83079.1 phage protein [Bergeriella denitrificans]